MSYDEKLLREFVRRSLRDSLDEVYSASAEGDATGWGGATEKVKGGSKTYKERWCYGRSAQPGDCVPSDGIMGLLGFPAEVDGVWNALFGKYNCAKARGLADPLAKLGSIPGGGQCSGLFPSLWGAATGTGKIFLDTLFNSSSPGHSAKAEAFSSNLFPNLKKWLLGGNISEANVRTLFEMSLLLEQEADVVDDLENSVLTDLAGVEGLINRIKSAPDVVSAVSQWKELMGGGGKELADLSSAEEGLSEEDVEKFDLAGGTVQIFVDKIVNPFMSTLIANMRDKIINVGLPPGSESAIKSAFNMAIEKIS